MLAKVSKRGIDEMLVMPRKAKRKDHDFCNLYNSKIFKAKQKEQVENAIGANEKMND